MFIPHGGGVTPVVHTVCTDLNQAVKARYQALKVAARVRRMRDGSTVPHLKPAECVDIMVEVLSDMDLHHVAADGCVKTGLRVHLDDSSQDHFIVREAGTFWKELNMRTKVNSAVAEVREEVKSGRLSWSFTDIRRLIRPYPKHKHADDVLENIGEDTALEQGELPYEDDGQGSDAGTESGGSNWSGADGYEAEDWSAAVAAVPEEQEIAESGDDAT